MAASSPSTSARHYAEAAFQVARHTNTFDAWIGSLDEAADLLSQSQAHLVLTSPAVAADDKQRALDAIFPQAISPVRNFLHILADRDRLGELPGIAESFRELADTERGVITADVTTAISLDANLQVVIAQRLGSYFGHDPERVVIRSRVDPDIIGGVIARVGDTLIDDSVRGRLGRLRQALARG